MIGHNNLRALHRDTKPLIWDDELAFRAQSYAEHLLAINHASDQVQLIHEKPSNGLGENLFWSDSSKVPSCAETSLSWY